MAEGGSVTCPLFVAVIPATRRPISQRGETLANEPQERRGARCHVAIARLLCAQLVAAAPSLAPPASHPLSAPPLHAACRPDPPQHPRELHHATRVTQLGRAHSVRHILVAFSV